MIDLDKPKKIEIVAVIANKRLDRSGVAILRKVVRFFEKRKFKILYDKNAARYLKRKTTPFNQLMSKADFAVTCGGDGTVIKVARHMGYKHVPVFAINLGTLGFLTEIQKDHKLIEALERIFDKGNYILDVRSMLRITIYRKGKKVETHLAINDAVINQGNFARLIELSAHMNQRKMTRFKADGMIVSTPTGSTGHSLSAGGPIVHPKLDALIFTPICPATLSITPIVIPSNRMITVTIETKRRYEDNSIALTIDGQIVTKLQYGDQIKFRRSSRHFIFARRTNTKYYKILRERLKWGD